MNKEQEKKLKWEPTCEMLEKLARNPPKWKGETIFVLRVLTVDKWEKKSSGYYPRYSVEESTYGVFRTVEEAERHMYHNADENGLYDETIFCQYLYEFPYGERWCWHRYVSCRVYDAHGNLTVQSVCSGMSDDDSVFGTFFGRPRDMMHPFKRGDIVEVLWGHEVSLAVMLHTPSTTEEVLEHYRRAKERDLERWGYDKIDNWLEFTAWENGVPKYFRGGDLLQDYSDDCYYVIDGLQDDKHDSHDHPATISLFAPHFKIPKRIRERFERYYQHWIDYNKSLGLTKF